MVGKHCCTVTYGTSSAPHQALRILQHLAEIEATKFPIAAQILMQDTFVDDILTGADSSEAALVQQSQVIALCKQGQFQLRKWTSNSSVILHAVLDNERSMLTDVLFDDELEARLKILGMQWNPKQDNFSYSFQCSNASTTKRLILSDLAHIFGPLGFLSPVTFLTKHMMQLLWTSGIGWDDSIPEQVQTMWQRDDLILQPATSNFINMTEVNKAKELSLREIVALKTGGQGFHSCNCKGKCETKKCTCFKSNLKCNSRCHNTTSCSNK
ncbi:hypothetical protein QTP88_020078 [Uroleucon formosanum]